MTTEIGTSSMLVKVIAKEQRREDLHGGVGRGKAIFPPFEVSKT